MIETREEYEEYKRIIAEPLTSFDVDINIHLRVEIQKEKFQLKNKANHSKFYKWCWDNLPHGNSCEECGKWLPEYNAGFISHIFSKGSNPSMKYDPRNINILCWDHHQQWEFKDQTKMSIFQKNEETKARLREEYNSLYRFK